MYKQDVLIWTIENESFLGVVSLKVLKLLLCKITHFTLHRKIALNSVCVSKCAVGSNLPSPQGAMNALLEMLQCTSWHFWVVVLLLSCLEHNAKKAQLEGENPQLLKSESFSISH